MKVTRRTKTKDLLPLLNEERMEALLKSVPPVPLKKPLLDMTIGEFIDAGDESFVLNILKARRAVVAFGRLRSYREEMDGIAKFLKSLEVPQSADEEAAANGVNFPTFAERMVLECQRAFGCKSMDEAMRCKFADYLLIYKEKQTAAQYERNYNAIQERKSRKK